MQNLAFYQDLHVRNIILGSCCLPVFHIREVFLPQQQHLEPSCYREWPHAQDNKPGFVSSSEFCHRPQVHLGKFLSWCDVMWCLCSQSIKWSYSLRMLLAVAAEQKLLDRKNVRAGLLQLWDCTSSSSLQPDSVTKSNEEPYVTWIISVRGFYTESKQI